MSTAVWHVRDYVRRFLDEGRIRELAWFLVASFAIAWLQWSLMPTADPPWFSLGMSQTVYFAVAFALAFAWLAVIVAGFIKCGWAGLLLLIPAKWGVFPLYWIGALYWACAAHRDCL